MSAIIRAYGENFDVDAFLADCTLPVCAVKRRGERERPGSRTNTRLHDRSGIHIVASDAEFDEFPRQVAEATAFLATHSGELTRLVGWPGVEGVDLDFGIARRDVYVQCDYFPADLVRLAGALGLSIALTQYPISDEGPDSSREEDRGSVG